MLLGYLFHFTPYIYIAVARWVTPYLDSTSTTPNIPSQHLDLKRDIVAFRRGNELVTKIDSFCYEPIQRPRKSLEDAYDKDWLITLNSLPKRSGNIYGLPLVNDLNLNNAQYFPTEAKYEIPGSEDALFELELSTSSGVIISTWAYKRSAPNDYRWSDFAALIWAELCAFSGDSPRNLRYIIRADIRNRHTASVMAQICPRPPCSAAVDPVFSNPSIFRELLGTPNGNGVGHLVLQNHDILGYKRISEIRVYCVEYHGRVRYDMVLKLEQQSL